VPLDVTCDESVAAAAKLVEERAGRLDVLVNNAGVPGGWPEEPTSIDLETVRRLVETNVIGVIRVSNAMLPLLRRSAHPRIVNQSSHVGSLALQTTPGVDLGGISGAYAPTITYLNAVTIQYAKELTGTNILVNNAFPGYVATDLNGFRGTQTPEQGAAIAIRLATVPDNGPTGQLFDDNGVVPWSCSDLSGTGLSASLLHPSEMTSLDVRKVGSAQTVPLGPSQAVKARLGSARRSVRRCPLPLNRVV
jgi:NAD(P)-dependent dehydrogenase (short-subunit alcohol dehydrogenase family)